MRSGGTPLSSNIRRMLGEITPIPAALRWDQSQNAFSVVSEPRNSLPATRPLPVTLSGQRSCIIKNDGARSRCGTVSAGSAAVAGDEYVSHASGRVSRARAVQRSGESEAEVVGHTPRRALVVTRVQRSPMYRHAFRSLDRGDTASTDGQGKVCQWDSWEIRSRRQHDVHVGRARRRWLQRQMFPTRREPLSYESNPHSATAFRYLLKKGFHIGWRRVDYNIHCSRKEDAGPR